MWAHKEEVTSEASKIFPNILLATCECNDIAASQAYAYMFIVRFLIDNTNRETYLLPLSYNQN